MLTILTDVERDDVYTSLTSSTQQANADVQTLSLDGFATYLSGDEHAARDGIAKLQKLANCIRDDGGLAGNRWAKWVEAVVTLKVRQERNGDIVISKDGKTCSFRKGMSEESIPKWHLFTKNTVTAKVTVLDMEAVIKWLSKTGEDDRGQKTVVSKDAQALSKRLYQVAVDERDRIIAAHAAARIADKAEPQPDEADKDEHTLDLFADLPTSSAVTA
jgi:hypothetical protein